MKPLPLALLLAAAACAADWPQWLGPRRDGGTPDPVAAWKDAPRVLWRRPVGNAYSSPVVAAGRAFVHAAVKGEQQESVTAFDAATGQELWSDRYERPAYTSVLGTGPRATPTVAGKRLFTLGINGLLSCYDAATGKRAWRVDLYQELKADLPPFMVCCSPLVVGDRVIVSVGGKGKCVVALAADTGKVLWQALDDPASTSSPVLFAGGPRKP
ncbi:MAG: PQQ-binding-like beta-propeller repeat protein, partial [Gemmataceae bacterium]